MQDTYQRFLEDTKDHEFSILNDNGLFRHLTMKKKGSCNCHYNITTWPGYLCISGDMGCFVFSRLADMFDFFRQSKGKINLDYWAEKIQHDRAGTRKFSQKKAEQVVWEIFKNWADEKDDQSLVDQQKERVEEEIIAFSEDAHELYRAAYEFERDPGGVDYSDFWDHNCEEYTFHYVWCCYAIVEAIKRYDERIAVIEAAKGGM